MQIAWLRHEDNWQDVKNAAMNTVGKDKGVYPTAAWKKKILLAEHSPIRLMQFAWKWSDLPYWVSVHIVRHKIGIEHFVSTQRTDRTGVDRTERPRTPRCSTSARRTRRRSSRSAASASAPAQALKRGRRGSFSRTRSQRSSRSLPPAWCSECVYRGFCPEMYGCGFDKTEEYKKELERYHAIPEVQK